MALVDGYTEGYTLKIAVARFFKFSYEEDFNAISRKYLNSSVVSKSSEIIGIKANSSMPDYS